jgi:hypothetical protein
MGIYDNLDKFNLIFHGDRREQEWGSVVLQRFPAYETLWRRYVVPLTNRIDPDFSFSGDRDTWIRLRDNVRSACEKMAMHNYSVFYYLARATKRIHSGQGEFPEDIFSLLDACGDNALAFCKAMRAILNDFGASVDFLPRQKNELCSISELSKDKPLRGGLVEVQEYRDTILHNPVLGRGIQVSREFLPKREFLQKVQLSWTEAARLKPEQLIDSEQLFSRLLDETAMFLQETWGSVIRELDAVRDTDKFKKQWALDQRFLPVAAPQVIVSTTQPFTVSGGHSIPYSPTAVMPVTLSSASSDIKVRSDPKSGE